MTATDIVEATSKATGVPQEVILGRRKTRITTRARFLAFHVLKERVPWISLSELGGLLGRDHSTAHHALNRASEMLVSDPDFKAAYERIKANLKHYAKPE